MPPTASALSPTGVSKPDHCPHQIAPEIEARIVELRGTHPGLRLNAKSECSSTRDNVHHEGDSDAGRQISGDDVREHIECMREQGFELPDPTRTDEGWAVLVDDPEDMGMETRRWREAAFVTCRPSPPPGAGDLIFSNDILPTERVDEFRACMSNEGFDLPAPRLTDGNVWRFPISEAGIDIGRDDWNRAVFVTCAPQ
jgi:hypothetical protein